MCIYSFCLLIHSLKDTWTTSVFLSVVSNVAILVTRCFQIICIYPQKWNCHIILVILLFNFDKLLDWCPQWVDHSVSLNSSRLNECDLIYSQSTNFKYFFDSIWHRMQWVVNELKLANWLEQGLVQSKLSMTSFSLRTMSWIMRILVLYFYLLHWFISAILSGTILNDSNFSQTTC